MAVISIKNKTKSGSLLVGNAYFQPTSYESIATVTATGSESSLTFSSIPGTYSSLQIRGMFTGDSSALMLRFNGDTTSKYYTHALEANGTNVYADSNGLLGQAYVGLIFGTSDSATAFGVMISDIIDYSSTSKYKTMKTLYGFDKNTAGVVAFDSGLWTST